MKAKDLRVGDVLTNIKRHKWCVTTHWSYSHGIGVQSQLTGEKRTIYQEELGMLWIAVHRDGKQIYPEVKE